MKKIVLIFLLGCSGQVELPKENDAGPSYIDSQAATLPYEQAQDAGARDVGAADTSPTPHCWSYDTCGGSWRGFTCPVGYTPPVETHCVPGPQGEQTDPVWCCYGTENP